MDNQEAKPGQRQEMLILARLLCIELERALEILRKVNPSQPESSH